MVLPDSRVVSTQGQETQGMIASSSDKNSWSTYVTRPQDMANPRPETCDDVNSQTYSARLSDLQNAYRSLVASSSECVPFFLLMKNLLHFRAYFFSIICILAGKYIYLKRSEHILPSS